MTQQVSNIPRFSDNEEFQGKTLKDYFKLILLNLIPIILIFSICTAAAILYSFSLKDKYCSTTKLKIEDKNANILAATFPNLNESKSEMFILTQIEILKSYYIRDWVAKALIDSVKVHTNTDKFSVLMTTNPVDKSRSIITQEALRGALTGLVNFEQPVSKVNLLDIKTETYNFEEASLISSTYAYVFVEYSKEIERLDITGVKNYLAKEKEHKLDELNTAEASLEDFQKQTGLISLESQAQDIVDNISSYEAAKKNTDIEIEATNNSLKILNEELKKIDPEFSTYIESKLNEPYLDEYAKKIAALEVNRDIELSILKDESSKKKVMNSYNDKLAPLQKNYEDMTNSYRAGILAETPADKQLLTGKILDAKLLLSTSYPKQNILSGQLKKYESEFNKLPSNSIELAKRERVRKSTEKLYLILEEKFQEASINERARIGNASILDPGLDNNGPVGPNRRNIIILGIAFGLILGFIFALGRDFFDRTIKDPEDLEKLDISLLSWIPTSAALKKIMPSKKMLIIENKNDISSEAFKALRTRIQYSIFKNESNKSILVTSSLPFEGKSFISVNFAGTFALSGKKTLLIDCDLRKPKVHTLMESDRYPGLCDRLLNNIDLKSIIRKSDIKNLDFITCGTIPPNPSELLGSEQMNSQLKELKQLYDFIIIDSPPFLTVTDAEILFNITDGTILVARAEKTPKLAFMTSFNKLRDINSQKLLGCVLNDFSYRKTYSRYYYRNHYYDYSYNTSDTMK
jgi:tyrosine-protein kinase Etk/Wzc